MTINCPAFTNDKTVPDKHLLDKGNISPTVEWWGVPPEAKSLALILNDPDAPINGLDKPPGNWTHWLVYNIRTNTSGFKEGFGDGGLMQSLTGSITATNDFGNDKYDGPAPPPGHGVHRYQMILLALDNLVLLKKLPTRNEFDAAIEGHVRATAMTTGTYEKPKAAGRQVPA